MLITTGGVLIRTRVREIRELGRATQGVTLIALDEGETLAGLEKVVESEDESDGAGNGDGGEGVEGGENGEAANGDERAAGDDAPQGAAD